MDSNVRLGAAMKALLEASNHRKLMNTQNRDLSQYRIKPPLPENVSPLPPSETTFPNVQAPPLTVDPQTYKPPMNPKTEEQMALIFQAIRSQTYVLRRHSDETTQRLAEAMEEMELSAGHVLQEQGAVRAQDDSLYVVQDGSLQVSVDGKVVDTIKAGSCIGQERLLLRGPNKATVTATQQSTLFRLDQMTFRTIVQQQHHLDTVEEGDKATDRQDRLVDREYSESSESEESTIDIDFEDSPVYMQQQAIRQAAQQYLTSKDDFEYIRLLGEGQFGKVWLVAATLPDLPAPLDSRQEFALKMQELGDGLRDNAEEAIHKEIDALKQLHHPFIVNLVRTYESEDSMDMLLGLISGGELWDELHRQDDTGAWLSGVPETRARFLTYVVADTLAFLHDREYAFRDLKPENIMIDKDGYPIIVDFGFAKHIPRGGRTFTCCGTPNYVAPEIVTNTGHGAAVDYWALGVIVYEMISGENPFYYDGMEQFALFEAIADEEPYAMPEDAEASRFVLDIICRFLNKDPALRLGSGGLREILEHPWFTGMPDVSEFRAKRVDYSENALLPLPVYEEGDCLDDDALDEVRSYDSFVEDDGYHQDPNDVYRVDKPCQNLNDTEIVVQRRFSFEDEQPRKVNPYPRRFSADDVTLYSSIHEKQPDDEVECEKPRIELFKVSFPRKRLKGYYVNMKSDEEKRNSHTRRSQVGAFLSQYLDTE
eukprot:Nitzschia sp. Nitz4//scaffold317_size20466//3252//5378//NITZ4_008662-RA/size20466-processed-gene-0.7-mRNA-1//1//CDS//3329547533//1558//frame0